MISQRTSVALEVIVIDDGSSDKTFEVVSSYDNSNIRVTRTKNAGAASARNVGLSMARGKWIAFLDADDAWHEDKLAIQFEELTKSSGNICITDVCEVIPGQPKGTIIRKPSVASLSSKQIIQLIFDSGLTRNTPTLLFDREYFGKGILFDPSLPLREDHAFLSRLVETGKLVHVAKPLVFRYVRKESLSHSLSFFSFVEKSLIFRKAMISNYPFINTFRHDLTFFKSCCSILLKRCFRSVCQLFRA